MAEHYIKIKAVDLNNNCPECYSKDGLRLTFKQKFVETSFYKSITSDIKYEMDCTTCNTPIYPVKWTEDIERVFEYHKKAFTPKQASTHLKKVTWLAIVSIVFIAVCIAATVVYSLL
ncbi:hypothetical protein [Aestuariibaculum suncheonense]|uniref:Uncharacterized protein n=1 Tax=Aestuariibaculum suncheonense TaxID=1028745 RepID=A0A8J6Q546_9FLAO|nr:hypothetical protein [Aestuariibaculum suncheonense]MBD0834070.1 hypothetical protein [Aestuariibaculum suncheonense]